MIKGLPRILKWEKNLMENDITNNNSLSVAYTGIDCLPELIDLLKLAIVTNGVVAVENNSIGSGLPVDNRFSVCGKVVGFDFTPPILNIAFSYGKTIFFQTAPQSISSTTNPFIRKTFTLTKTEW